MSVPPLIELDRVSKFYREGEVTIRALQKVSLRIRAGELVSISGSSGSGKSTLLHMIGLLDTPTAGQVVINGETITQETSDRRLAKLRRDSIGFVFQTFNLLPQATALENVELPLSYAGLRGRVERASSLLRQVGLAHRLDHLPAKLSGGERQRVAIARSLANDPEVILADEPTGNLDSKSGRQIIRLFTSLNRAEKTVIIVTHDPEIAMVAKRRISVRDGRIVSSR